MSTQPKSKQDPRRSLVLVIAIVLIALWIWMTNRAEQTANVKAISAAAGRIGLVMGALWFAWPNLRRPASWLPPGFAMLGILMLGFIATQPRMIVVLAPAFVGLLTLASILKAFRN